MFVEIKKGTIFNVDPQEVREIFFRSNTDRKWDFNVWLKDEKTLSVEFDTEAECLGAIELMKNVAKKYSLMFDQQ